ncbi:CheR family methyltransferase [Arenibaculum pallidiluteum]|uniref:CheR family methyltransferase n=1 Tax=Arenibaculum pallidiluteum TaxID=2812559 RepID=UPI001A97659B|nr:protein-glutamate O-methyltransferase CheR [Arenibaculum pallidiluteum]
MSPRHATLLRHAAFPRVKQLVAELTGMVFYADKDETLAAILERRLAMLGLRDLGIYLDRLSDPDERETLVSEVAIGETYFLRHLAQWEALESIVLPALIQRNAATRRLRCWSAGCAVGAEPYTLATLLRGRFARELDGWGVTILGTDLNRNALDAARAGIYGSWSFRATPDSFRERWFRPHGDGWEILPEIRASVEFRRHNLVTDAIPPDGGAFDLILCRNVMIYFDAPTIATLAKALHGALVEEGWLVVGHAETSPRAFADFETVMLPETTLYRRHAGPPRGGAAPTVRPGRPTARPAPGPARGAATQSPPGPAPANGRRPDPRQPPPRTPGPRESVPPSPKPAAGGPAPPPRAQGLPDDMAIRGLIGRGDWAAAQAACTARLEADALDAGAQALMGLLLDERGDAAAAEGAYRRALFLDRRAVLAHYQLGCLLRRRGELSKARRAFRNVLELLASAEDAAALPEAGGATAGELRRAAMLQLKTLEET